MKRAAVLGLFLLCASAAFGFGKATTDLRVQYSAEAYQGWPVSYALSINGVRGVAPETVRCCLGQTGPVGLGGTVLTIPHHKDKAAVAVEVTWLDVHAEAIFAASFSFTTTELDGWKGGVVPLVLSFRPNGEIILLTDGAELAATRLGPEQEILSGQDLGNALKADGLGRAIVRDDFVVLRRACADIVASPPEPFDDVRNLIAAPVLAEMIAERRNDLPKGDC